MKKYSLKKFNRKTKKWQLIKENNDYNDIYNSFFKIVKQNKYICEITEDNNPIDAFTPNFLRKDGINYEYISY